MSENENKNVNENKSSLENNHHDQELVSVTTTTTTTITRPSRKRSHEETFLDSALLDEDSNDETKLKGGNALNSVHQNLGALEYSSNTTMATDTPTLEQIPFDHLSNIVSFLSLEDVRLLASVCKKLQKGIGLSVIDQGLEIAVRKSWYGSYRTHGVARAAFEIPNLFGTRTRIIRFSFDCWDQGYGNGEGQVFIVGNREGDDTRLKSASSQEQLFSEWNVITHTSITEHHQIHANLTFQPEPGERYYVWYRVGGGGGHTLYMLNAEVKYIIVNDFGMIAKKAASFLRSAGLWARPSHAKSLLLGVPFVVTVVESLIEATLQGKETDSILTQFMLQHVLKTVDEPSLRALHDLLCNLQSYHDRVRAENPMLASH